jgi:hypothetical protein
MPSEYAAAAPSRDARPTALAVGVDVGTAIEISAGGGTARGGAAAVVLGGRTATYGIGTNSALSARWVVLDSFVDGETLAP